MKYHLIIFTLFVCSILSAQTTQTPEQIRAQMAKIRQTTNWEDPAAAAKANAQIRELSKKLMAGNSAMGGNSGQQQSGDNQSKDAQKLNELNQEMMEYKMDLWSQSFKLAAGGEGADFLLAEPIREEIVKDYEDDESPGVNSTDWLESITILMINVSMPGVREIIDQMTSFKGIKILIVTCDEQGAYVDLNKILTNAKGYPLEELHILNFGSSVSFLPAAVGNFSNLRKLSLLNNNIKKLPPAMAKLNHLEILYADLNPFQTLFPEIGNMKSLKNLGIAKTGLPESEITQIQKALPNCEILR